MKKYTLLLFCFIVSLALSAQEVISTQGDHYTDGTGSVSFTIGEVVSNTGTDGNSQVTQGFHQTKWRVVGIESHQVTYEVTVYPNPTKDILNIKTKAFEGVNYKLIDMQGKVVRENQLTSNISTIQVSDIALGTYSLILSNQKQNLKTVKLIKSK